jgi:hypothetical protein
MSQENVVLVRSAFAAFEEGNVSRMLDLMADDLVTYRADPDGATHRLRGPVPPLPQRTFSRRGVRRPGERWMRGGRVELLVSLDLDEPAPRAFEQLVTVGRRRRCLKLSHQLAQLHRSFFGSHPLTSLVVDGPRVGRPVKVCNGRAFGILRSREGGHLADRRAAKLAARFEVEALGRNVLLGVDPTHERANRAARDLLHRFDEVLDRRGLEEHAGVPQPLVLVQLGQPALGGSEAVFERHDQDVPPGVDRRAADHCSSSCDNWPPIGPKDSATGP